MAKTENSAPADLFGNPWAPPRETRGRKAHVRDAEVAKKIAVSRANGATVEQVAALSGLSEPTLRKYYFRELDKGPEIVEALVDMAIFENALQGRAGAQRLIKEQLRKGKAAVPLAPTRPVRAAKAKAEPRAKPMGKKAQADLDAQTADRGTGWAKILN